MIKKRRIFQINEEYAWDVQDYFVKNAVHVNSDIGLGDYSCFLILMENYVRCKNPLVEIFPDGYVYKCDADDIMPPNYGY